jgi:hypothetical protein
MVIAANYATRNWLISLADGHFSNFPQYKDYHKDWDLAITRQTLKFKGGDVPAGSLILFQVEKGINGLSGTLLEFNNYHHCMVDNIYLSKIQFLPTSH